MFTFIACQRSGEGYVFSCVYLSECLPSTTLSVQGLIPSPLQTRSNMFMIMSKFLQEIPNQILHMTHSSEVKELLYNMYTC